MTYRSRLAVSGLVLAATSALIYVALAWWAYQQQLDGLAPAGGNWEPTYWDYVRPGLQMSTQFMFAAGIIMAMVAAAMIRRGSPPEDAQFQRPTDDALPEPPPDDDLFRP